MTPFALLALGIAWVAQTPLPASPFVEAPPAFRPAAREVDNWRREATLALDLAPEATFALVAGDDIRGVTRCVRLNNYWCIKKAGWAGELASDGEGHVAFASAREGAAVAALLLRRYYMDFGLKSARAIVSRWAPAQCGGLVAGRVGRTPRIMSASLGGGLARKGLGGTLRARFLASHTVAGWAKASTKTTTMRTTSARPLGSRVARASAPSAASAPATRRSVVVDRVGPMMDTPIIMAGLGAPSREPVRLAMLPYAGVAMGPTPGRLSSLPSFPSLPPPTSCSGDNVRIANYAAKTAEGVATPDADLGLFDADGKPTSSLAKVMANMASVEIGPLRASDAVIAAGVAAIAARRP